MHSLDRVNDDTANLEGILLDTSVDAEAIDIPIDQTAESNDVDTDVDSEEALSDSSDDYDPFFGVEDDRSPDEDRHSYSNRLPETEDRFLSPKSMDTSEGPRSISPNRIGLADSLGESVDATKDVSAGDRSHQCKIARHSVGREAILLFLPSYTVVLVPSMLIV